LSEAALPKGSIVVNREFTLWDLKYYIIAALIFSLLETGLIIFLIVQRHRKMRAEESLRQKTEELDQFFNVTLDLLGIANTDGYFLRVNPAMERVLGYSQEELTARPFFDFVHPDDVDKTREAVSALESQQKLFLFENRYRCKDGTYRWLQWSSAPVGKLIYAAARDVTERKLAEQALEERLRFERLVSDISAKFVNIPPDRVDSEIERGLRQILKFFQVDRVGLLRLSRSKTSWQVTHTVYSDDVPTVPVGVEMPRSIHPWAYDKLIRKREVLSFSSLDDLPAEANIDRQTWIEWGVRSTLLIPIISGEPVDHIIAINKVKSERVWPEEFTPRLRLLGEILVNALERKQMQDKLRNAAEEWQSTFDSVQDLIMILDPEFRVVRANAAALSLFKLSSEGVVGKRCHDLMHGTSEPVETCPLTKMMRTKRHEEVELYDEKTDAWLHASVDPVFDDKGKIIRVIHTVKDVTVQKRGEIEASRTRRELLRMDRLSRMGELTASLAHELNQPLAAILSNAQAALRFLQSEKPDLNELREILQDIASEDKRAGGVIRSLRAMMKQEEKDKERLFINEIARDVVSLFHSEAVLRNVVIETDFAESLPFVFADKIQLQQVVLNLMMNAAEAMDHGAPEGRKILLKTRRTDDGAIQVAVRDCGPGIEEENLGRVFQPFFTTKGAGLGMGLAFSRSIIESHGGHIWARNNPDKGVTFFFEIPIR
jgi:PAS domain S-box-containing protein